MSTIEARWVWFGIPVNAEVFGPIQSPDMDDAWAEREKSALIEQGFRCIEDIPGLRFLIAPRDNDADLSSFVFVRRLDP